MDNETCTIKWFELGNIVCEFYEKKDNMLVYYANDIEFINNIINTPSYPEYITLTSTQIFYLETIFGNNIKPKTFNYLSPDSNIILFDVQTKASNLGVKIILNREKELIMLEIDKTLTLAGNKKIDDDFMHEIVLI